VASYFFIGIILHNCFSLGKGENYCCKCVMILFGIMNFNVSISNTLFACVFYLFALFLFLSFFFFFLKFAM
jgi:hypothetical protein